MSFSRLNAIEGVNQRIDSDFIFYDKGSDNISAYFGENVFNDESMKEYLSEKAYKSFKFNLKDGKKPDDKLSEKIAAGMKKWAEEKGATHFAHWFQPLTGKTAEKHDSFFSLSPDGKVIDEFSWKVLVQQEPDGSSFPGGGLRQTHQARGYTAWDPSSPAFILDVENRKTLYIPTVFITYTGLALDYKLPLLRSQSYLEEKAIPVAKMFDNKINHIYGTLGWEQEYFLVDEAMYYARPDLVMTGRTLLGKASPKGQQLDDHYFGSIPERVYAYMRDVEVESHRLGIPIRTRHNEVAPGQYEFAPIFEEINIAVDHNTLLMDLMDRIAKRHKLVVLFHEKPFAGVNGSGKHNNWSLATDTGVNLLAPTKNPGENLEFLTFFMNTIMAVKNYDDLLRATVATASNDHRLGANEAPPAIVSVFIGESMTKMLNDIERGRATDKDVKNTLDLLAKLPDLKKDNTDRNRTSPFAFTGNRFEIRMVGSKQNCASPMTIMNTIVAKQLDDFKKDVDKLIAKGDNQETAILSVLKRYIRSTRSIRFEGNNYSEEWKNEAAKRGLSNKSLTPEALDAFVDKKAVKLFKDAGVYSEVELRAFHSVMLEQYSMLVDIEAKALKELAMNFVVPAAVDYQTVLASNISSLKEIGIKNDGYSAQLGLVNKLSDNISNVVTNIENLAVALEKADGIDDEKENALFYATDILSLMANIRQSCDSIECLADDNNWPLLKYREMLFIK